VLRRTLVAAGCAALRQTGIIIGHVDHLGQRGRAECSEEAFADDQNFEIRDEDAENIHTIQDILDFLAAQGLS